MGELVNTPAAAAGAKAALEQLQRNVIAYRRAIGFNRSVVVERQLLGQARICIGADRNEFYDNFWDYSSVEEAKAEALLWDPTKTPEPERWQRHALSGRRRPGGCEALEYVAS